MMRSVDLASQVVAAVNEKATPCFSRIFRGLQKSMQFEREKPHPNAYSVAIYFVDFVDDAFNSREPIVFGKAIEPGFKRGINCVVHIGQKELLRIKERFYEVSGCYARLA